MKVELLNRYAIFHCDAETQEALKKHFGYLAPMRQFMPSFQEGGWDGFINFFKRGRIATGLFLLKQKELKKAGFKLRVKDLRQTPAFQKIVWPEDSRPFQVASEDAMEKASATGGLIICATGTGKTRCAGELFRRLLGTGCFVVDELTLLEQTRKAFSELLGEEIGIVGKGIFSPKRITVATVQTLNAHRHKKDFLRWMKSITVMFIDEFHESLNKRSLDVVKNARPQAVFGLTATLELTKPEVLYPAVELAGPLVFEYTLKEGEDEGYLVGGEVISLQVYTKFRSSKDYASDYANIIVRNRIRNDATEAVARAAVFNGHRAVVLVEHLEHLDRLSRRLLDVKHRNLCGAVDSVLRTSAIREMENGETPLLLCTKVFRKGVDIKTCDVIIDATGGKSGNNAVQRHGRGRRISEGKTGMIHIDISDSGNCFSAAALMRIEAFKKIGIPVRTVHWSTFTDNASALNEIFNPV